MTQAPRFAANHQVEWSLRPVVYGALLTTTGLVGPAEVPSKRRYTFRDITRIAHLLGVPLVGPPAHPFRSLEALRVVCLFAADARCLDLAVALAHACWGAGRDLTDIGVLEAVVAEVGLEAGSLGERIGEAAVKDALREHTDAALQAGIFGVPTFAYQGELFWGHDRLDHLAARLDGRLPGPDAAATTMEGRPRGADRRGSPMRTEATER